MDVVNRIRRSLICVAIIAVSGSLCAQEKPAPSEVLTLANNLVRADNFDAALAELLEKLKMAPKSPDVAQAKLTAALRCLWSDKLDTCIGLATEVIEQYPEPSLTSPALLTLGGAYHRLKDKAKAVEALERGLAMERAMKGGAAHWNGYPVHQILGAHYIATRQWDKASQIYDEWKPPAFCGNCYDAMDSERRKTLIICLIHTNRHADAATAAWKWLFDRGLTRRSAHPAAALGLIRLYEEAGQRDDLRRLLDELDPPQLVHNAKPAIPVAVVKPREKDAAIEQTVAEMRWAMILLGTTTERSQIDAFLGKEDEASRKQSAIARHVAGWLLARDHKNGVSRIVTVARKGNHDPVNLAELLAAIDTPAARNRLELMAGSGGGRNGLAIWHVILGHFTDADEFIPRERRTPLAVSRLAELEPSYSVDYGHYYAAWPKPALGSLPTELPGELLDGKQK